MPKRKSSNQSKGPRLLPRAERRNIARAERKHDPFRQAKLSSQGRGNHSQMTIAQTKDRRMFSYPVQTLKSGHIVRRYHPVAILFTGKRYSYAGRR